MGGGGGGGGETKQELYSIIYINSLPCLQSRAMIY